MASSHSLVFFLVITASISSSAASLPLQLLSLLSLKASLTDPLSSLHDWRLPGPCSWTGITCDQTTGDVVSLDLSRKNLSGSIPAGIRLLHRLSHLNLSRNSFEGRLEPALFDLVNLETLDISHNNFNGSFPVGLSKLRSLTVLDAYSNSFVGSIPRGIGRLAFLERLSLGGSFFDGEIPAEIGGLSRLRYLHLAGNLFRGPPPPELGRLPRLRYLDVSSANLSGRIPPEIGNLTRLESLFLFKNRFSGEIPARFSNLSSLMVLDLSDNHLAGPIPAGFASLSELTLLSLMNNNLSGPIPPSIGDLPNLEALLLWDNSLTGPIPPRLGMNGKLERLDVSSNSLSGPALAKCTSLWRIRIEGNRFTGPIPTGFGLLSNLTYADLSRNNFSGPIPTDLGRSPRLEYLNISENPLNTTLTSNFWTAPSLQIFSASHADLKGPIPDFIKGCRSLYKIELQGNSLEGSVPWDIGNCEKLLSLKLGSNRLTGIIPWELSTLPSITDVDLSMNGLSGTIPSSFDNCSTLESFNVSHNRLVGPLPSSGPVLKFLHPSSFAGNDGLCGDLIGRPCPSPDPPAQEQQQEPRRASSAGPSVVWIMAGAFGVALSVLVAGTRWCGRTGPAAEAAAEAGPWRLTAFQRLNFTAEDVAECVSGSEAIVGMGSTGTVYRAEMPNGEIIAVKKLWGKQKETMTPMKMKRKGGSVLAEVEVLGNVRHRNIVRLLGCCSNNETTLLLYEYMPNGSLDELLHGKSRNNSNKGMTVKADWRTKYNIAMGVAQGICYLHHDCHPVIVHRDLKPSNILLDAEMEARVADFGVAKLIQASDETMSVIAGSYGYIAPEYAYTLQVDEKSDIYSYGVVLMEILSGKRSVDTTEFGEGNSIVDWVRARVRSREGLTEVLGGCDEASPVREEMMLVLRVALLCTSSNPSARPAMRDVVSMLREAMPKNKLVSDAAGGAAASPAKGF
ncbi:Leucine-rich repeat receptor-like protein kinase TDR [Acorus calamus]|uniref:non-specific serine/threonine protein kinase n=1 Tax=Acorus calamus TaxID=4465 RepID=A0AAV9DXB3_ACOCL|nr:Leucine-rich repeat receptor-like protein kinase TDR [Acorus calamus]